MREKTKPDDTTLDELDRAAAEDLTAARWATPRPWAWATSNSMRRLSSVPSGKIGDVAYAHVAHDGVPDIAILQDDMALIERAANAFESRAKAVRDLVAEVRRLRKRDSAWQRATGCGEPEQVHERTVRLCSCDGAILPQIGDEVDACWECDGLVKVTESDEPVDASAADGAAP